MPPGQFVIIQNQVPVGAEGCLVPADISPAFRGAGQMDVRLVSSGAEVGYAIFPVMRNNLPAATEASDLNRIKVESFDVDISLPADPADPDNLMPDAVRTLFTNLGESSPLLHYSVPFVASIASGGGNTSAAVNAIPADLARAIRGTGFLSSTAYAQVTTTIRARGTTDGGRSVVSDPFAYPVRVCDGCLIASAPVCPVPSAPTHPGNACNVAQDEPVDCCMNGSDLVCPPRVAGL